MTKRLVTSITLQAKCSDACFVCAHGPDGETVQTGDGYVPNFVPNAYNDVVTLEIDVKTGKILNWEMPTDAEILRDLEGM